MKNENNDKIISLLEKSDKAIILPLNLESLEGWQNIALSHISRDKAKNDQEYDFLHFSFICDGGKRDIKVLLTNDIYALLWCNFASQEQKEYIAKKVKQKLLPKMTNDILQLYLKEKSNILKVFFGKDSKTGYYTICSKEPKLDALDTDCDNIPFEK